MAEVVNTFTKGLDTDTNPLNFSNEHYYYAKNFRLLVDEQLGSLTLTNGKGIELMFTTYSSSTVSLTKRIVGACEIDDSLILFMSIPSTGGGYIYKIPLPLDDITTPYNLITDSNGYLLTSKTFNFGTKLKTIPRIETGDVRKVYWVDGTNPIRYINIDDEDLASKSVEEFDLVRRCLLGTPIFEQVIGGNLQCGVYRYSYCLFNVYGSETSYSDLSQIVPLSAGELVSDATSKNGWNFYGSASSEYSSKGIQVSITQDSDLSDLQETFDNIRIVRLYYSNQTDVPTVTIIYEGSNESTVLVDDTGSINLGTLAYEEFVARNMYIIPSTMETKNDYLFFGNVSQKEYDVTFDARAYRFNSSNQGKLYNATTQVLEWDVSTYGYSVPSTYDCLNLYNLVEQDDYIGNTDTIRGSSDDCIYQSDGTTLGGEGINISYEFITTDIAYNAQTTYYLTPDDYATIGYQRDEIYRFGVVFYNKYGERSFVKWIGDIRMPNQTDSPIFYSFNLKILGVRFTLSNLPSGVTGYQIVRLPRRVQDQTVVDNGYVGHFRAEGIGNLYFGQAANTYTTPDSDISHRPKMEGSASPRKSILEYISGETTYNKNNSSNYSRVDIYQGSSSTSWFRTGLPAPTTNYDNVSVSYLSPTLSKVKYIKTLGTYLYSGVRDIDNEGLLPAIFGPSLKVKGTTIAIGSRGIKGTTLILKLYQDLTTSDTGGGTVDYPGYASRRNNVRGYGGFTYEARTTNEYIPCSPIIPYNTLTVDVYQGDTFLSWFEYNRVLWYDDGEGGSDWSGHRYAQVVRMMVESKINFTYTTNMKMSSYDKFAGTTSSLTTLDLRYLAMWETAGSYLFYNGGEYFVQDFDLYTYNPVYSTTHYEDTILPRPLYMNDTTEFPVRVYRTDKKYNGELSDSWSKIRVNNYKDLDSKYGRLVELKAFNNYLYAFQPNGIALLPVEDREVVQSNNTSVLSVGTGGVLERYDYISNSSGTSFASSVVNTLNNIYYVDDRNKKICLLTDKVQFLSDMKGVMYYMGTKTFDSCATLYNPKYGEIWFCIDGETLVYNEYTQTFISTLSTSFQEGLQFGKDIIAYEDTTINTYTRTNLFRLDTGLYGAYLSTKQRANGAGYDDIPSSESSLRFIVNPNNKTKNRFDSIDINTYATLSNGTDESNDVTFSNSTFTTSYQTSTHTFYTEAIRKFRTWRLNTIRGASNDRLHDNYMKVYLVYDPNSFTSTSTNIKLNVNDIVTHFIPTFVR